MSEAILIFGGTFDPPHRAHVELPPLVAERLGCGRTLYIPAAINPLKQNEPPTPAAERLAMLHLALADSQRCEVSMIEIDRAGPSYTVDTLETLSERHDGQLYLLMGSDQALLFKQWRAWERILQLARPAVMLRPPVGIDGYREALGQAYSPDEVDRWWRWMVEVPQMDVSARLIRERLAHGEPTDDALHPDVLAYVLARGLYGARRPA